MHDARTRLLLLTSLALLAGCGGGGGGPSKRATAAGVGSASGAFVMSAVPTAPDARMTTDITALALSVSAGNAAVELRGLTLRASGTADESVAIGAVRLVGDDDRNGRVTAADPVLASAAAPAFAADDGSVTLTLTNPLTLAAGASLQLLVAVDAPAIGQTAASRVGQTIVLTLDAAAVQASRAPGGSFPLTGSVTLVLNDHLLITEVVADPQAAEFVELYNPTSRPIDLTNVYLTDADDLNAAKTVEYYYLPTGANYGPSNTVADYLVRFPAGATIAPGQCITVATEGTGFMTTYGKPADYCTRSPAGGSIQMLTSTGGNVWTAAPTGSSSSLFPFGEPVVLFTWDGQSDLVQDVDAIYLGTKTTSNAGDPHDKTAIAVDGPDADGAPSVYLSDTPASQQANVTGSIVQRIDLTEGTERTTGGNGVTGHDELSEPVNLTFVTATVATPGTP